MPGLYNSFQYLCPLGTSCAYIGSTEYVETGPPAPGKVSRATSLNHPIASRPERWTLKESVSVVPGQGLDK